MNDVLNIKKEAVQYSARRFLELLGACQLALELKDSHNQWEAIMDLQTALSDRADTHLKLLEQLEDEENASLLEIAPWASSLLPGKGAVNE